MLFSIFTIEGLLDSFHETFCTLTGPCADCLKKKRARLNQSRLMSVSQIGPSFGNVFWNVRNQVLQLNVDHAFRRRRRCRRLCRRRLHTENCFLSF
jgi:hypothetical protein